MIGGNGSGKTTLAKLLVGLYASESGQIDLEPLRVWEEPAQHRPARAAPASPQRLLERGLESIRHLPPPERLWLGLPQGEAGAPRIQYSDHRTGEWRATSGTPPCPSSSTWPDFWPWPSSSLS